MSFVGKKCKMKQETFFKAKTKSKKANKSILQQLQNRQALNILDQPRFQIIFHDLRISGELLILENEKM